MRPSPSELTNQELREKYEDYYQKVENKHGIGSSDLRYLDGLEDEIKERNGQIRSTVKVTFPKDEIPEPERGGVVTDFLL